MVDILFIEICPFNIPWSFVAQDLKEFTETLCFTYLIDYIRGREAI